MTQHNKTIAVLLTVHNRKEHTLKCLRELFSQEIPLGYELKVFLTDDGCTDGTSAAIYKEFPQVHVIQGDGNLYWNRGMYCAWEEAAKENPDFYLWLNDDTYLLGGAIETLLACYNAKRDSVIVGSCCSSVDGHVTYGGQFHGRLIQPAGYMQRCETFNGNIVLVPRSIFQLIGNLDWKYEHAIGDLDYGWMVTRSGRYNYITGSFIGVCDRNPKPAKWTMPDVPFKERWKNYHSPLGYGQPGSLFHFNRKNFGLVKAIVIWISNHVRVCFPRIWTHR